MIENFLKYIKPKSKTKLIYFIEYIFLIFLNFFKLIIKKIFTLIPYKFYENLLPYSLDFYQFKKLKNVNKFPKRENLWEFAMDKIGSQNAISFIEFGTFEGYSIKYFSKINNNPESKFIGCDTFEGMPEKWNRIPKGMWSVDGKFPEIDDKRVKFIKGKFQNTYTEIEKNIDENNILLFHFDADLYSSTLFLLTKLDKYKEYYAIFDEFTGHESRAVYNYCQSYDADIEFFGKTIGYSNTPHRVFCKIKFKDTN
jgi:hypothetical protein